MAKYNHKIEDWWRHLGTYDRERVSGYHSTALCFNVAQFLFVTDEWWESLTDDEKTEIYEEFFSEV